MHHQNASHSEAFLCLLPCLCLSSDICAANRFGPVVISRRGTQQESEALALELGSEDGCKRIGIALLVLNSYGVAI